MKKLSSLVIAALATFAAGCVVYGAVTFPATRTVVKASTPDAETIYVRNLAPQYVSDQSIRDAIPAWERAANGEFAKAWHTTPVHLIFIGKAAAPRGALTAVFVKKGPVKGALAYHTVSRGAPAITVYAGTDDYYGYSNSVSFTHELFELLADPEVSIANQGWPYDYVWFTHPDGSAGRTSQAEGTVWINEVCDPVEADHYVRKGAHGGDVWVSDFITPNWFNDEVAGGYDYMGLTQQPFTLTPGGYAQFYDAVLGWQAVTNFRHAGRDASGYLKAEGDEILGH